MADPWERESEVGPWGRELVEDKWLEMLLEEVALVKETAVEPPLETLHFQDLDFG